MTNAEHPGPDRSSETADDDLGAIAVLVGSTLHAVAATTVVDHDRNVADIGPGPTAALAQGAPEVATPLALVVDDATLPSAAVSRRRRRSWPVIATAAALVIVVIGVLAVARDERSLTTAPAEPGDPDADLTTSTLLPAPEDATFIVPPAVAGLPLARIQVDGLTDPDLARNTTDPAWPDPRVAVGPLAIPWEPVGRWNLFLTASYGPLRGIEGVGDPPQARVSVLAGSTLDPRTPRIGSSDDPNGHVVDLGELCPAVVRGPDGPTSVPAITFSGESPCRAVTVVVAPDQIVVIDAAPGTDLSDVLTPSDRATVTELEERFAGVRGLGLLRPFLVALAGTISAADLPPSDDAEAPPSPQPTTTTAATVAPTVLDGS